MRADARQNRDQLVATARAMVDAGEALTLNEVARRSGVGVATAYRHFSEVRELSAAVAAESLAGLQSVFARALAATDPSDALEMLFVGVVELELADPTVASLVHAPSTEIPVVQEVLAGLARAATHLVERGRRARVVRKSITADDLCCLLAGVHAAAQGAAEPISAARRYARIVLAGLRPKAR